MIKRITLICLMTLFSLSLTNPAQAVSEDRILVLVEELKEALEYAGYQSLPDYLMNLEETQSNNVQLMQAIEDINNLTTLGPSGQ